MKNQETLLTKLLNNLSTTLNISNNGSFRLNFDELKKTIEKIKEVDKSNTIYQHKLKNLLKSKEEKIKVLISENGELKKQLKDYLATRMRLLNYSREQIFQLENQTETRLLLKHKNLIDNHMTEQFRLAIMDDYSKQEQTNYQPYKVKEVTNGN